MWVLKDNEFMRLRQQTPLPEEPEDKGVSFGQAAHLNGFMEAES